MWGLLSGCLAKPSVTLDVLDTTQCDPHTRPDCVSVSVGFIEERLHNLVDLAVTRQALKACHERTK